MLRFPMVILQGHGAKWAKCMFNAITQAPPLVDRFEIAACKTFGFSLTSE